MDGMSPRRSFIARVGRTGFSMLLSLALLGIAASGVAFSQDYGPDHRGYGNDKYADGNGACIHTHYVSAGENLTWIAERYGVTVDELARANSLDDADYIVEDQELCIPHGDGKSKYDGYDRPDDGHQGYGDSDHRDSGYDDRHYGDNGYDKSDDYGMPDRRDGSYQERADNRECGSWREDAYGYWYQDCVVNGDDGKHYGGEGYGGPEHRKYEQQGCSSYDSHGDSSRDCGSKPGSRYEGAHDWNFRNQECVDHRPGYGYSPYDCGVNGDDNGNGDNGNGDNGNGNGNSEPPNGAG